MMNYNCDHINRKFIIIDRSEDKDYDIFECICHTKYWVNKQTGRVDQLQRDWSKVEADERNG